MNIKTIVLIVAVLALVAGATLLRTSREVVEKDITVSGSMRISEELKEGRAVLLDVRTEEELKTDGYAAGSIHFDLARLQAGELPDYPYETKMYVYCKSGGRSGQAEEILETNGFIDVENIGGLVDWERAGGSVVR